MKIWTSLALLLLAAGPAAAHPGDHAGFDLAGLLAHVFETDHIVFGLIAALVGVLAFRAGRRAEARESAKRREDRP